LQQSVDVVLKRFVSDSGNRRVRLGAAQLFLGHRFASHSLERKKRQEWLEQGHLEERFSFFCPSRFA
jgi:hypothetical protein